MHAVDQFSATDHLEVPASKSQDAGYQTRYKLARQLTDLVVLPKSKLSNNERDFVADILIRTLEQLDLEIRLEVAERLAGFADVPVQLQRYLMTDAPQVAVLLLEKVSVVPETILLEASQLGPEFRKAIATRDDLSPAVVDTLLTFCEIDLDLSLLRRKDVSLSCKSIDSLVARSEVEEALCEPLLRRSELRLDHGLRMFWWLKTDMRKLVLSRCATDRSIIQDAMHNLFVEVFTSDNPDLHVKSILTLIDRRHRPRGKNGEAVTMDIVVKTLKLARQNPSDDFAHAVGMLAGVSSATAGRVLRDFSGEPFAILCKSVGISRKAYSELFDDTTGAADSALVYSEEKCEDLLGVFDSIARDYSRTILRYWDWKKDLMVKDTSRDPAAPATMSSLSSGYLGAV